MLLFPQRPSSPKPIRLDPDLGSDFFQLGEGKALILYWPSGLNPPLTNEGLGNKDELMNIDLAGNVSWQN